MTIKPFKLSETDKENLVKIAPDITALEGELNRAERAGIDVTELKQKFDKMKQLRLGILREYGGE